MNRRPRRLAVLALALAGLAVAGPVAGDGVVPEDPAPEATPPPRPKAAPKPKPKTPAQPQAKPEPAPAPPPPVVAPAPPPEPPPPEPKRQLAADETVPILGRKVVGANNEELGRVVNVLVDSTGRARAAVIDFGGFLGVGNRKIAVDWGQLVFKPGAPDRLIGLTMTREQIQGAAEFKENTPKPVEVAAPPKDEAAPAKPAPTDPGAAKRAP